MGTYQCHEKKTQIFDGGHYGSDGGHGHYDSHGYDSNGKCMHSNGCHHPYDPTGHYGGHHGPYHGSNNGHHHHNNYDGHKNPYHSNDHHHGHYHGSNPGHYHGSNNHHHHGSNNNHHHHGHYDGSNNGHGHYHGSNNNHYHGSNNGHHHYGSNNGHHHHLGRRDAEAERAKDHGSNDSNNGGYMNERMHEKICKVQCEWPSIPRRYLCHEETNKKGELKTVCDSDTITCDMDKQKWDMKPWGCDEPFA